MWRYSTPLLKYECARNGKVADEPGNLNYGPTSSLTTNPVQYQRARKQDSVDQEPVEAKILRCFISAFSWSKEPKEIFM